MIRSLLTPTLLLLAACGPEPDLGSVPKDLLDDPCGLERPVQLLALASNELVPFHSNTVTRFGDRWLIAVTELTSPFEGGLPRSSTQVSSRVVSVDWCGLESPRTVAEGADHILEPGEDGLPWLGCSSITGEAVVLDPTGRRAPLPLGIVEHCGSIREQHGSIWVQREGSGEGDELVRLSGGGVIEVVADGLSPEGLSFQVGEDALWTLHETGELVERIGSAEAQVLADEVGRFVVLDERFVLMGEEPEPFAYGPWSLLDRETDELRPITVGGHLQVRPVSVPHQRSAIFSHDRGDGSLDVLRVELPSLSRTSLTTPGHVVAENAAGDVLLERTRSTADGFEGQLLLWRAGTAHTEVLFDGWVPLVEMHDDHVMGWELDDYAPGPGQEVNARLLRIPFDGSAPEVVIDDVYQPLALDDGRWVAVRDYAPDALGTLTVLDPLSGEEWVLDEGVSAFFRRYNTWDHPFGADDAVGADEPVVYSVHDDDERNGLWRVGADAGL